MKIYVCQSMEDTDNVIVTSDEILADEIAEEYGEFAQVWEFILEDDGTWKEVW